MPNNQMQYNSQQNYPRHAIRLILPFFSSNNDITLYTHHVKSDISDHFLALHDFLFSKIRKPDSMLPDHDDVFDDKVFFPHCLFHFCQEPKMFLSSLGFSGKSRIYIKDKYSIALNASRMHLYNRNDLLNKYLTASKSKPADYMCQCKTCFYTKSCIALHDKPSQDFSGCHFDYNNPLYKENPKKEVFIKKNKPQCIKADLIHTRCSALGVNKHVNNTEFILNVITSATDYLFYEKAADQAITIVICCEKEYKQTISTLIFDVLSKLRKTPNFSFVLSLYEPILLDSENKVWKAKWLSSSMHVENGQALTKEKQIPIHPKKH